MADQQLPGRMWLSEDLRRIVTDAEQDRVQRFRTTGLPHEEIVRRGEAAMKLPNPSEVQHKLHELALEAGYRDAAAVVRLLIADQEFRRGSHGGSLQEIFAAEETPIEYLIPDLLPKPGTVLMHGRGGCGKTMAVHALATELRLPVYSLDLLAPGRLGDVLTATCHEVSKAGRTGVYDCEVTNQNGLRIAVFRGRSYTVKGKPAVAG
jgi:hypothetical protein